MPSPLLNFYNTAEYSFLFHPHWGGGPIAEAIIHGEIDSAAPLHIFDPESQGGRYNTPLISSAQKNMSALQRCYDKMPDDGGLITIRDNFFTYGKIVNPKRFYLSLDRRIPFGIIGTSPGRSTIINLKPDEPAIEIDVGTYAYMFPGGSPCHVFRDLVVVSKGGGLNFISAGNSLDVIQLTNVNAIHCQDYGFKFAGGFWGISIQRCHAMFSVGPGFWFANDLLSAGGDLWTLNITSMWNDDVGVRAQGWGFADAFIHVEGNLEQGLDFDNCFGEIALWQEGNNLSAGEPDRFIIPQSKLRNCSEALVIRDGNTWLTSQTGLDFDCDEISHRNTSIRLPQYDNARNVKLEGSNVPLPALASNIIVVNTFWQSGYEPTLSGTELTFPAGSFGHAATGFETGPVLSTYLNFTEINAENFTAGDWVELHFDLEPDKAFANWLDAHRDSVIYSHLGQGPFGSGKFFAHYIRRSGPQRWVAKIQVTSTGAGGYFRFAFPNTTSTDVTQPTAPVKLKFNNLKFYHIKQ